MNGNREFAKTQFQFLNFSSIRFFQTLRLFSSWKGKKSPRKRNKGKNQNNRNYIRKKKGTYPDEESKEGRKVGAKDFAADPAVFHQTFARPSIRLQIKPLPTANVYTETHV